MQFDIQSNQNTKLKEIRALSQKKQRDERKLFIVEGIHPIGEAFRSDFEIAYMVYSPERLNSPFALKLIEDLKSIGVPVFSTSTELFKNLAEKENPQGVLAVVKHKDFTLSDLDPKRSGWLVALVQPQNPGNIGTVLRTIDSVGADGLILIDGGADAYHPNAVRASMGSLFWVPVIKTNFNAFVQWAASEQYTLYGSSSRGNQPYDQIKYQFPSVLLLGSEREGLAESHIQHCHSLLRLPMHGSSSSLNLSVSAGIFLYEMLKFKPQ